MPLLHLETTVVLPEDKRNALLAALSKAVAASLAKPEQYVMVTLSQTAISMSGKPSDAAFVDNRSIGGLTGDVNRKLSQQISKLLKDALELTADRIYLNFTDVKAGNWGW